MNNSIADIKVEPVLNQRRHLFEKSKRWGTLLAKFISIQVVVQALGLVAGLLLIRTLTQREYAYFTLANTMQGTLLILADVGVGNALSATGGQVWQDKQRFSELIATGLHVRKNLAWIGGSVSLPILCWMLISNGTGVVYAAILTAAVLLGVSYRLTTDVLGMVPRLHGQVDQLQKLDMAASVFRIVVIGAACITFVNAAVGIFVASLSYGLQFFLLRRWTAKTIDSKAPTNAEDKQTILRVVKQTAPTSIYYCLQGQLMVFVISTFGNIRTIAEMGALGRVAALVTIIGSVMSSIVLPRFARCQDKRQLKAMWWQIIGGYALLSGILMTLAVFLPGPFLWLLGKKYAHLDQELAYIVFSMIINLLAGTIYSLNATRAWMKDAWLFIPITTTAYVLLFPFVDLSSVKGVALFGSLPIIPGLLPLLYRTYYSIRHMPATATC